MWVEGIHIEPNASCAPHKVFYCTFYTDGTLEKFHLWQRYLFALSVASVIKGLTKVRLVAMATEHKKADQNMFRI